MLFGDAHAVAEAARSPPPGRGRRSGRGRGARRDAADDGGETLDGAKAGGSDVDRGNWIAERQSAAMDLCPFFSLSSSSKTVMGMTTRCSSKLRIEFGS